MNHQVLMLVELVLAIRDFKTLLFALPNGGDTSKTSPQTSLPPHPPACSDTAITSHPPPAPAADIFGTGGYVLEMPLS